MTPLAKEAQVLAYNQSLALVHTDILRQRIREIILLWAEHKGLSPVSEWVIRHETRLRIMTRNQVKKRLVAFYIQSLENLNC
jgi:hypothetical protein